MIRLSLLFIFIVYLLSLGKISIIETFSLVNIITVLTTFGAALVGAYSEIEIMEEKFVSFAKSLYPNKKFITSDKNK